MENNLPRIGVGVIIKKNNKILLGKRISSHGKGTWNFPGGHLDLGEKILTCAKREVKEETGLEIDNLQIGPFTNDIFSKDKHYITIFVIAGSFNGEAKVMEPNKCEKWQWFKWDKLPSPLFLPLKNLIKRKFNPFEVKNDKIKKGKNE